MFKSPNTSTQETSPDSPVSTGDFNCDGKLDIQVVNTPDNSISILLGITATERFNCSSASRCPERALSLWLWGISIEMAIFILQLETVILIFLRYS